MYIKVVGQLEKDIVHSLGAYSMSPNELVETTSAAKASVCRALRRLLTKGVLERRKRKASSRWEYVYSIVRDTEVVDIEDAVFTEIKEI